jgi:hypothetical protein
MNSLGAGRNKSSRAESLLAGEYAMRGHVRNFIRSFWVAKSHLEGHESVPEIVRGNNNAGSARAKISKK